jgi:hypothetical protein
VQLLGRTHDMVLPGGRQGGRGSRSAPPTREVSTAAAAAAAAKQARNRRRAPSPAPAGHACGSKRLAGSAGPAGAARERVGVSGDEMLTAAGAAANGDRLGHAHDGVGFSDNPSNALCLIPTSSAWLSASCWARLVCEWLCCCCLEEQPRTRGLLQCGCNSTQLERKVEGHGAVCGHESPHERSRSECDGSSAAATSGECLACTGGLRAPPLLSKHTAHAVTASAAPASAAPARTAAGPHPSQHAHLAQTPTTWKEIATNSVTHARQNTTPTQHTGCHLHRLRLPPTLSGSAAQNKDPPPRQVPPAPSIDTSTCYCCGGGTAL